MKLFSVEESLELVGVKTDEKAETNPPSLNHSSKPDHSGEINMIQNEYTQLRGRQRYNDDNYGGEGDRLFTLRDKIPKVNCSIERTPY
jgi:hypothetical protein